MTGKGKGSKRQPVDSRLRGNDGIHSKCHPPSFPRKRESTRNHEWGIFRTSGNPPGSPLMDTENQ